MMKSEKKNYIWLLIFMNMFILVYCETCHVLGKVLQGVKRFG